MADYADSSAVGVYDVDCTTKGKALCQQAGVRGYPTILHGDPSNMGALTKYNGARTFDALSKFAEAMLADGRPVAPPAPPPKPTGKTDAKPTAKPAAKTTAKPSVKPAAIPPQPKANAGKGARADRVKVGQTKRPLASLRRPQSSLPPDPDRHLAGLPLAKLLQGGRLRGSHQLEVKAKLRHHHGSRERLTRGALWVLLTLRRKKQLARRRRAAKQRPGPGKWEPQRPRARWVRSTARQRPKQALQGQASRHSGGPRLKRSSMAGTRRTRGVRMRRQRRGGKRQQQIRSSNFQCVAAACNGGVSWHDQNDAIGRSQVNSGAACTNQKFSRAGSPLFPPSAHS